MQLVTHGDIAYSVLLLAFGYEHLLVLRISVRILNRRFSGLHIVALGSFGTSHATGHCVISILFIIWSSEHALIANTDFCLHYTIIAFT